MASNFNSTSNLAIVSLALGELSPKAIILSIVLFPLILWRGSKTKPREYTEQEKMALNRIIEIERMPGFGLTGVALPWGVFAEYKNLQRRAAQIVLY